MAVGVADIERIVCGDATRPPISLPARACHVIKRAAGFLLVEDAHPDAPRLVQLLRKWLALAVEAEQEEIAPGVPEFGPERGASLLSPTVRITSQLVVSHQVGEPLESLSTRHPHRF